MNILIADDHELVRGGLARIIAEEFPMATIHEAINGLQAEKMARKGKWAIIISDMAMPEKSGLDVLKQLRSEGIKTPLLIISIHPENQYAIRVLRAGANGYIAKDCPRAEFVKAVSTILSGKKYISGEIAEKLAESIDEDKSKEPHELLSDRELEVLKLLASGKTVSDIADNLSLSTATISTFRARILEKMKLTNNAELMHYAISMQLVKSGS
ncbi:MAG TPA: response regulator transcription factor [Bacteroidia bacterium]